MSIPPAIRAELDQTHEWWGAQYKTLLKSLIPRDAAHHVDHDIEEPLTTWGGTELVKPYCGTCGVTIESSPDG